MIGDVLMLQPLHDDIARKIFKIVKRSGGFAKKVISVAGESGTGKSEIAHNIRILCKLQGLKAKILHLDNYYNTSPDDRTRVRMEKGIDFVGDHEILWRDVSAHIRAFRQNRGVELPFIDLYTNHEDTLKTTFEGIDVLVIEGLYATKANADFRFFIDKTYHDTKFEQLARKKEKQTRFRQKVLEKEHIVVQGHREEADYFIKFTASGSRQSCRIISNGRGKESAIRLLPASGRK